MAQKPLEQPDDGMKHVEFEQNELFVHLVEN